ISHRPTRCYDSSTMPYFTYRSLEALQDDIAARNVAIQLLEDMQPLAAPLSIGGLAASNRLAVHPMEGCDGNLDGTPGELTFRRWLGFARGGAAVLWGEATAVTLGARANRRQLVVSRETIPELGRLLNETRAARRDRFGTDDG